MPTDMKTRGQQTVETILAREWAAHRSFWLGGAAVFICAAFLWPLLGLSPEAPYFETALRGVVTALSALLLPALFALRLIWKTVKESAETLSAAEEAAFLQGAARGLRAPLAAAAVTITLLQILLFTIL